MCACVHARMLLVEVVTHHTCSNTSPGSSSLPSGANLSQMETLHWKTVTFLPMKPISEEAGVAALSASLAGPHISVHRTGRTERDRSGASPEAGMGIAVGSGQPWSSSARKRLFLLSKPLSDTPGHFSTTPTALGQPSGAGDWQARQGAVCPASGLAPRPAPCGRRGLATLLLEAREWVRTLLDSAPRQSAVPQALSWKHQHSKLWRSR